MAITEEWSGDDPRRPLDPGWVAEHRAPLPEPDVEVTEDGDVEATVNDKPEPFPEREGLDLRGLNVQERKWVLAVSETEQAKYRDLLLTSKRAARRALHETGDE
jgi:hypothetical protein